MPLLTQLFFIHVQGFPHCRMAICQPLVDTVTFSVTSDYIYKSTRKRKPCVFLRIILGKVSRPVKLSRNSETVRIRMIGTVCISSNIYTLLEAKKIHQPLGFMGHGSKTNNVYS